MYASSGENSCVGAASSASLDGEREKERERGLISVGEVEQNAKRTCEQTVVARPRPCLSYYITIIHGDNSSHGATVVIWKKIDRIYKFSSSTRADPSADPNLHCQLLQSNHPGVFLAVSPHSLPSFQDNLILKITMGVGVFLFCCCYWWWWCFFELK